MSYPTRNDIVAAHPIASHLAAIGHPIAKSGAKHVCKCPFHEDKSPSMSVDVERGLWFCHACNFGGSVVDLVMRIKGLTVKQALREMAIDAHLITAEQYDAPRKTATYEYKDAHGNSVMKVDRVDMGLNKKFSQYREVDGKSVFSITGVQRTLYRMEVWASKDEVHLCEGEKCVHALERLGYDATCNPGGSSAWCSGFAAYLKDKHVSIWPDSDSAGQKWQAAVTTALEGKCASIRTAHVPPPYNDVADVLLAQGDEQGADVVKAILAASPKVMRGADLPLLSSAECWDLYQKRVKSIESEGVDLSRWLPSMKSCTRVLMPGDLAVFLTDTGVGKTTIHVNIADSQRPIPTILFELELSAEPMTERFIAKTTRTNTLDVETNVRSGKVYDVRHWDHVFICPESKLDIGRMEDIINRAELKMGVKPKLILLDYIGLMNDKGGGKRYEKMSNIAEGLKVLAKSTNTVIIISSQISRNNERTEVSLHDAKDSGCLSKATTKVLTCAGFQSMQFNEAKVATLKTGRIKMHDAKKLESGTKHCIRLSMASGKFVDCTPDHRILTSDGWVEAQNVTSDMSVATVRKIPQPSGAVSIREARFIGWMLGDGCTRGCTPTFTCADKDLSQRFKKEAASLYGIYAKNRKLKDGMQHEEIAVSIGEHNGRTRNPCTESLKRWGIWGVMAHAKKISEEFMRVADDTSVAELLSGLIDTDGCVSKSNGRINVRFDSASEDLAWGVMWCMMRLGVHARISSSFDGRLVFGKYHRLKMWRVLVDAGKEVAILRSWLTLCNRKMEALNAATLSTKPSNQSNTLPVWVWPNVARYAKEQGIKDRWVVMASLQKRRITSDRLRELTAVVKLPDNLVEMANPKIFWDRLKYIQDVGPQDTFDLTVNPSHPNFVANGIIVHNSIENSAQLVIGAWRPSPGEITMKILKQTKRAGQMKIDCLFDGDKQLITERPVAFGRMAEVRQDFPIDVEPFNPSEF